MDTKCREKLRVSLLAYARRGKAARRSTRTSAQLLVTLGASNSIYFSNSKITLVHNMIEFVIRGNLFLTMGAFHNDHHTVTQWGRQRVKSTLNKTFKKINVIFCKFAKYVEITFV